MVPDFQRKMASDPTSNTLVAGEYTVEFAVPLPGAGGGLSSFASHDRRGRRDLMAVETRPWQPARGQALAALIGAPIEGVLSPLAHGPAKPPGKPESYFVIVQAPSGPSLAAAARPWSEGELLEQLLRPAVRALERLKQRGLTHRAVRPDNLFHGNAGQPLVLGCAWAAPPASLQPALFEPPYVAMCLPSGRGDGTIADDVYALGVTMLVLALGQLPLAELDDGEIVRRKLERGSFGALAGDARLTGMIGDLVRGMLAEDPDHRPPLALLADPPTARGRRVAARPPRRAQRPFEFSGQTIWEARTLSYAISRDPGAGLAVLRDGSAERWLRRSLGEPALATRIGDRVAASRAEAVSGAAADVVVGKLLVQAASILDPLAPLCWPGATIWPDGVGTAFAAAQEGPAGQADAIASIVETEAARIWGNEREDRCDLALIRTDARLHRAALRTRNEGKLLLYLLNPLLACGSPLLAGRCVVRIVDLLAAIDAAAGSGRGQSLPVDQHIAAFTSVRAEEPVESGVLAGGPETAAAQLRLLARLQARFHPGPLPGITKWLAGHAGALLASWHNKPRRQRLEAELHLRAETGQLGPMQALLEDAEARAADVQGAARAASVLAAADAELRRLDESVAEHGELARRLGQEIAAGSGLAALVAALAVAAFG